MYKLTKEWFGNSPRKIKQGSLKKTKLNFPVTAVSKNKQSPFVFIFFHCD